MVNQFAAALKRLAIAASLRSLTLRQAKPQSVSPRIRDASAPGSDAWLFDAADDGIAASAASLGAELTRMADNIGALRGLLSELARFETPLVREPLLADAPNYGWSDPALFDGGPTEAPAVFADDASEAAAFLFDDVVPVEAPSPTVWRASIAEADTSPAHPVS
ncbi:MAG: hypothetical protein AAF753_02105 [Pseudomonadota bacterium]